MIIVVYAMQLRVTQNNIPKYKFVVVCLVASVCVCVCVCVSFIFKLLKANLDLETSFLARWYIFRILSSSFYIRVIGWTKVTVTGGAKVRSVNVAKCAHLQVVHLLLIGKLMYQSWVSAGRNMFLPDMWFKPV